MPGFGEIPADTNAPFIHQRYPIIERRSVKGLVDGDEGRAGVKELDPASGSNMLEAVTDDGGG